MKSEFHGKDPEQREPVFPGREVVNTGRKYVYSSPEECEFYGNKGEWINDGQIMICPGCGVDVT